MVHVHLGEHLPNLRCTLEVRNRRENNVYLLYISNYLYIYISVNTPFKNHYVLIGKYIFVIFLSVFVISNFRGTCLSIEILKGYMARESLGTPDIRSLVGVSSLRRNCFNDM